MNLNFEEISFKIIAFAGEAKGHAMQAIFYAKEGKFEESLKELEFSDKSMMQAESAHFDVITAEAAGEKLLIPVLFMHAEDQLLTTQTIMILAKEFIDVYKIIKK